MKKYKELVIGLGIIAVMLMSLIGNLVQMGKIDNLEAKIADNTIEQNEVIADYMSAKADYEDLLNEVEAKDEQIYNIMNDENYKVSIKYDGATIIYESTDEDKGWFGRSHSTTKIVSSLIGVN